MFALFLFTFKENIKCAKKYYVWPWNALTVINKIVFTSIEAMVEFSGKKLKPKRLSKTPLTYVNLYSFERSRYFFVGRNNYLRLQVTLNSRYAKIVIRYSFYRIFAER